MAWIRLTTKNGRDVVINTQHIAYIAVPPEEEAERGIGAGIVFSDNLGEIFPVKEDWQDIAQKIGIGEIMRL